MSNRSEVIEKQHLEAVKNSLRHAMRAIDIRVSNYAREVQEHKVYAWEHRDEMDHIEKIAQRESIAQAAFTMDMADNQRKRIRKLLASPYFGRVDFIEQGRNEALPIYIGIHGYYDDERKQTLVHDWRAPISSLFYDHEPGTAHYEAPSGRVDGELSLKRQFRIRHGVMEYMFDSAVNIMDELLQQELSRTSDDHMRNIVSTIQRDQNAIIRNEHAQVLIIQGVAGSGKTSIALHRIAYLLYKFKETLSSKDILIISPNRVFGDYIANVLPELGEEQIAETEMERLAEELLDHKYKFQTSFEQNALLLEGKDEGLAQRIRAKSATGFLKKLGEYAAYVEKCAFTPEEIWIARKPVPAWFIEESFNKHRYLPVSKRVARMAADIEGKIGFHYNYDLQLEERRTLKEKLKGMIHVTTLRKNYQAFFDWLGEPEWFKPAKGSRLEYNDVFPLIYLKMRLEGLSHNYKQVKHLLVDEMQDYTPVQYAVIARLFDCNKTILGDANQSLNPYGSSTAESIGEVFPQATRAKLCKSYRSSYEITRFAQHIVPNAELEAVERHGVPPEVRGFAGGKKELEHIRRLLREFADSDHRTFGIICKTEKEAARLYKSLAAEVEDIHLLNAQSAAFFDGVVVTSVHLAKGLEFDRVIVSHVSADNYRSEIERNLLYIACTRAMHRLTLTYTGQPSHFIADEIS